MTTVAETLDVYTRPGRLYERRDDGSVHCYACAHNCVIRPGRRGVCQVRHNGAGELRVPWGYVSTAAVDPVEKKPFYHLLPGADAFTFGMLGCDFCCDFCQNWMTSQVIRDDAASLGAQYVQPVSPEQLVAAARRARAPLMVSSYNEPLITSEWAIDVFRLAQQAGMRCAYVSNGYATEQVLEELRPYLTGYKIDLKTMQAAHYRSLGGSIKPVLATIRRAHALGLWVEIVTLVIPGFNDSADEFKELAEFVAAVSPDIPVHFTAFHPDYKMTDPRPTPAVTLQSAAEIAQAAGLHYVYAGNLPGRVGSLEDTFCPSCKTRLVQRRGFAVLTNRVTAEGKCPDCAAPIAGVWA
ncbi:MAG TPA: AmmeMemoRadiSam system radical SAM enzyme [Anaerolineaceae bacterium]|nr:AmmeMemoRadiSam system radical SAM enzyme [Anaerolineaceae bacterium]